MSFRFPGNTEHLQRGAAPGCEAACDRCFAGLLSLATRTLTPALACLWIVGLLGGCASAGGRPAQSTIGCARAVVSRHVPAGQPDKLTHCVAAAMIARYCSGTEAVLASVGKEAADLLGPGDADWADWRADRTGLRCARNAADDMAVTQCCLATLGR